jgi:hypothetical protein
MDALCKLPLFQNAQTGIIYADCEGPEAEVVCTCISCECCDPAIEEDGCSQASLGNIDDYIIEAVYQRRKYDFEPDDEDEDAGSLLFRS